MSEEEQKRVFSSNLRALMNERNKTQKEVAAAIGVSPQTFNTWMQGVAIPRMGKIQNLADYFNVNKSVLIDAPAANAPSMPTLTEEEMAIALGYRKADENIKNGIAGLLGIKRKETASSGSINKVG